MEVKIRKLSTKLDIWSGRNLSLFGKCLIAKAIGISQLVYSASSLDINPDDILKIKKSIFNFIWNKKQDKIKRDVLCNDYADGGLRAPDPIILFKSLRLAWISRLLIRTQNLVEKWKSIPTHFFKRYGGLNFLLHCNYDTKLVKESSIPHFYKLILLYFLELKTLYSCASDYDLFLFNNKDILIDRKPFCYNAWIEKGIMSVHDLMDQDGKLLSFQMFQERYGIKTNFLSYLQVLSAIPKHIILKTRSAQIKHTFLPENTQFQLSPSVTIDLTKLKCKDYYWLFISGTKTVPVGPTKWEKELSVGNINWEQKFMQIGKTCRENKLREFNFKLIHRIVVTRKELCIYGIENSNKCIYCDEPDSILHTFVNCPKTRYFINGVTSWFNRVHNCRLKPSLIEELFGITSSNDACTSYSLKFNQCLLFAKYYLYHQKLNSKSCNLTEFISKLNWKYCIGSFDK